MDEHFVTHELCRQKHDGIANEFESVDKRLAWLFAGLLLLVSVVGFGWYAVSTRASAQDLKTAEQHINAVDREVGGIAATLVGIKEDTKEIKQILRESER